MPTSFYSSLAETQGSVSRRQFFSAVADLEDMSFLYQAISADPNSDYWIAFWGGNEVERDGPLALLAKQIYGWTDDELSSVFTLAATHDP
jgi:hypothetical protein